MTDTPLRWRRRHRLAWRSLCTVLALVVLLVGTALGFQQVLAGHLGRIDGTFSGLSERPRPPSGSAGDAVDIVVLTVDQSAAPVGPAGVTAPRWLPQATHVDALTLLHIDGDRRGASSTLVPLTATVDVPGRGPEQLGSIVAGDDPALTVATVERLTGIRVDHLMALDWAGLSSLVDKADGIPIDVTATGRTTMNGAQVTAFVGQRDGYADPVLGPVLRFQAVMRELMEDTLHTAFRKHPFALYGVLDTVSRHLSVDDGWSASSMRNLGISLRNLRSAGIDYYVAPPTGGDATAFWAALRDDRGAAWAADHPSVTIPPTVG